MGSTTELARTDHDERTIVGVFDEETGARTAMQRLERAGMPPDRVGIVAGNVRQAREAAGAYSGQGALAGAMLGALLVAVTLVFGGAVVGRNPAAVVLAGVIVIIGLAFIGSLAGRARVFKREVYAALENDVAAGDVLVTVTCETPDAVDRTRALLERAGARDVRIEGTAEGL